MSRRPSFQFYPADWRKESALRLCSMGARGLWADMLCIMHEGEPYGHLTFQGDKIEPNELSRLVGENPTAVKKWLKELASRGVYSVTSDGVIFSRRMARDEHSRERRAEIGQANGAKGAEFGKLGAEHGIKGGRPRKENGDNNPPKKPPYNPRPSTSSSSAPSSEGKHQALPPNLISNLEPSRENPPSGITDPGIALNYVCIEADWRAANDTQRQNAISIIAGWLALGCSLELILGGIALALKRDPAPTRSLKRFDSTIRGMRRDQVGELPVTEGDVRQQIGGLSKRMSVQ